LKIDKDNVGAIKRVMNTRSYIIKTQNGGVKVLTIDDLKSKKLSYKVFFETEKLKGYVIHPDSLQL
jgi:hypothetical protein